jgi:hypothetical protein
VLYNPPGLALAWALALARALAPAKLPRVGVTKRASGLFCLLLRVVARLLPQSLAPLPEAERHAPSASAILHGAHLTSCSNRRLPQRHWGGRLRVPWLPMCRSRARLTLPSSTYQHPPASTDFRHRYCAVSSTAPMAARLGQGFQYRQEATCAVITSHRGTSELSQASWILYISRGRGSMPPQPYRLLFIRARDAHCFDTILGWTGIPFSTSSD